MCVSEQSSWFMHPQESRYVVLMFNKFLRAEVKQHTPTKWSLNAFPTREPVKEEERWRRKKSRKFCTTLRTKQPNTTLSHDFFTGPSEFRPKGRPTGAKYKTFRKLWQSLCNCYFYLLSFLCKNLSSLLGLLRRSENTIILRGQLICYLLENIKHCKQSWY